MLEKPGGLNDRTLMELTNLLDNASKRVKKSESVHHGTKGGHKTFLKLPEEMSE